MMTAWAAGSVHPMADVRSALGQAGEMTVCMQLLKYDKRQLPRSNDAV